MTIYSCNRKIIGDRSIYAESIVLVETNSKMGVFWFLTSVDEVAGSACVRIQGKSKDDSSNANKLKSVQTVKLNSEDEGA